MKVSVILFTLLRGDRDLGVLVEVFWAVTGSPEPLSLCLSSRCSRWWNPSVPGRAEATEPHNSHRSCPVTTIAWSLVLFLRHVASSSTTESVFSLLLSLIHLLNHLTVADSSSMIAWYCSQWLCFLSPYFSNSGKLISVYSTIPQAWTIAPFHSLQPKTFLSVSSPAK